VRSFHENTDSRRGGGSRGGCRRSGRGQPSVRERVEPGQRWLAQMRETISLTGRLEPEDLTPQMPEEFTDLYRRWRSEQQ